MILFEASVGVNEIIPLINMLVNSIETTIRIQSKHFHLNCNPFRIAITAVSIPKLKLHVRL